MEFQARYKYSQTLHKCIVAYTELANKVISTSYSLDNLVNQKKQTHQYSTSSTSENGSLGILTLDQLEDLLAAQAAEIENSLFALNSNAQQFGLVLGILFDVHSQLLQHNESSAMNEKATKTQEANLPTSNIDTSLDNSLHSKTKTKKKAKKNEMLENRSVGDKLDTSTKTVQKAELASLLEISGLSLPVLVQWAKEVLNVAAKEYNKLVYYLNHINPSAQVDTLSSELQKLECATKTTPVLVVYPWPSYTPRRPNSPKTLNKSATKDIVSIQGFCLFGTTFEQLDPQIEIDISAKLRLVDLLTQYHQNSSAATSS
ncbi:hypothetical protein BB561_005829 [Smittium simulii]|uniref:Uncharacterized protein n=1 Tax=Smittium simulii TaxID=133385 RepID=A0A2T9Y811_9FUNG|nr:hypothetical protein BB561_005829 [Smittium simulii]